ncbi:YtxH domain-containing protein [Calothrix sp. FACHB-1219]|uniref:YtxH domain-containing protein n=1 Tax=unclassified Calothrix TaxID=2619626 RepID=UPI001689542D|nr:MULTISPECIES: YtxH domain-containing protein [unclassified Calothrix]MBD2201385.1 YtxH domain-containing protein [Calothrix sp. FACHB-168]MBD2215817.1 YtxH domain-containing protein [Calothrix sp. FACHB-1219]
MSNNRSGVFIGGMMLGATIGALTGLLVAPRTGRETRKLLKKSADALPELAEDLSTSVQLQADRLSANALRNWDETLDRLRDAIAAGIIASQRESQVLKRQNVVETHHSDAQTEEDSDSLTQHLER